MFEEKPRTPVTHVSHLQTSPPPICISPPHQRATPLIVLADQQAAVQSFNETVNNIQSQNSILKRQANYVFKCAAAVE